MDNNTPIEQLNIQVQSNAAAAAKGLDKLTQSLDKLKALSDAVSGIDGSGAAKLTALASAAGRLGVNGSSSAFSTAIRRLERLSQIDFSNLNGSAASMTDLAQTIGRVMGMDGGNRAQMQDLVEQNQPQLPDVEAPGGEVTDTQTVERVTVSWERLRTVLGRIGHAVSTVATGFVRLAASGAVNFAKLLGKYFSALTAPIRGVAGLIGTLASRMKNMLIRNIAKFFLGDLKQGFNDLYQWADGVGDKFASSMDKIYSNSIYVRNSLAAVAAPIINAIAPAVEFLADKFVDLVNLVNQFISALTGAATWTKAIRQQASYGDTISKTNRKAKELKNTLLGFDEINRLNDNTGSSGGSGSGSALSYRNMFATDTVDTGIAAFAERIRQDIAAQDWTSLGKDLGDRINGIFGSISWGNMGIMVGNALNAVIVTGYNLLNTVNFMAIGSRIALFLSNAIKGINWYTLGELFTLCITNLFDFAIGFIRDMDWKATGAAIGDFFRGVFDKASEWLKGVDWIQLGDDLASAISDAVSGLNVWGLFDSFVTFFGNLLKAVSGLAFSFGINLAREMWNGLINSLAQWSINETGIFSNIGNRISGKDRVNTTSGWNAKAAGGYVSTGEAFIAREAGPELVGRIGHKTAVANNDQIVQGISAGVQNANDGVISAIYAIGQQIIQTVQNEDRGVYLDGAEIARNVTKHQRNMSRAYG